MMHYHAENRVSVTVDCDAEGDLIEAILDMDRFQDRWWQIPLAGAGAILAELAG